MTGDISYGGDLAEAGLLLGGLIIGGAVVGTAIAVGAIGSAVVAGAEKLHDNVVATKDEIRKVQAERDILMKNLKDKAGSVNALNTSGFNAYELSTYKEQEDRLISRLDDIMKRAETATSQDAQKQLANEMNAVINDFNAYKKTLNERMEKSEAVKKEYNAIHSKMDSITKLRKNRVIDLIETGDKEIEDTSKAEKDIEGITEAFHDAVVDMMGNHDYSAVECTKILTYDETMKIINSASYSPKQRLAKMRRLFQDFDSVSNAMEKTMQDKKDAYREYYKLAFELGEIEPLSNFETVEDIDCAIEKAKEEKKNILIRHKVMETIDEVMASHGFNVISNEELVKAGKAETRLYGIDDESAIQVFISKNNKVTMKTVGIGFDENIDKDEDEKLYQKQVSFCSLHPKITEELAEKGIVISNTRVNEADKKYNKKIAIKEYQKKTAKRRNTSDYSTTANNKVKYMK
jgi:hypothetical protein